MKKIFIYIVMLSFTAVSCKKSFIELTPKDSYSPETFFKTEAQFRQGVIAAYAPLRDLMNQDFYVAEMRSDNSHYQPYPSNRGTAYLFKENIDDFLDGPTNGNTNTVYFACYSGIAKANIVIERLQDAEIATAAKNDIEGQAKFLRAFYYFKLVRLFGAVPIYLKEVKKADDAFVSRSPVETVYAQITDDVKDAIVKLSNPVFGANTNQQSGQATKGAATMLYGDVLMTQKKYGDAEIVLGTLAGMGYVLQTQYAEAFSTSKKNSRESIFEVQYLEGQALGTAPSNFIYQFLPRTTTTILITNTATNNSTTGGWNTPTQDIIDAYEPGDTRKDASIAIAEGTYNGSDQLVISANKGINDTPTPGKTRVPYIKKYLHTPHPAPNNTNDNWPVYRYSDALLLLAEALNENGKSNLALTPLNTVRARAFGNTTNNIVTTDPVLLRDIIAKERRVELAFENHRWHDLVRTGKAVQVMTAHGIKMKQQFNYLSPASYNITPDKLLFQIPQSEIEINPNL